LLKAAAIWPGGAARQLWPTCCPRGRSRGIVRCARPASDHSSSGSPRGGQDTYGMYPHGWTPKPAANVVRSLG